VDTRAALRAEYIERIASDATTEHISLGDDFDVLSGAAQPETIVEQLDVSSRTHGRRTELVFYEEGFLRVREWQRRRKTDDFLLGLRFLDPEPTTTRYLPKRVLQVAAGFAGFGLLAALAAVLTSWDAFFVPAAVAGMTGAVIAGLLFAHMSHEKTAFSTASGQAVALTLVGTADSFKRCRAIVPQISHAIEAAQVKNFQSRIDYLRQEMHEHYRLKEHGVIDADACGDATRRILAQFG
jgi:hypothetical protein